MIQYFATDIFKKIFTFSIKWQVIENVLLDFLKFLAIINTLSFKDIFLVRCILITKLQISQIVNISLNKFNITL